MLTLNDFEKKWVDYTCKLYTPFKYMSGGKNLIDTGEFEYPNLLTNSDFEATNLVTNGNFEAGDPPTDWTLTSNAGETVSRSGVQKKIGSYSALVTRGGADCWLYQVFAGSQATAYALGGWIWASVADRARLTVGDGVDESHSSYHSGGSSWEWLELSHTTNAAASDYKAYLGVLTGDTAAYFDGIIMVLGSSLTPTGWTLTGTGAVTHYDFFSKIGTYSACLTRDSNDAYLKQDAWTGVGMKGVTYAAGMWVWASVASRGALNLNDNEQNQTTYHTGGSSWEFLTDEITVHASATRLLVRGAVLTANTTAYFDSPVLVEGSSLTPGWTGTADFAIFPSGDQYKIGSSSLALQRNGTNGSGYYDVSGYAAYQGKSVTFGVWLYSDDGGASDVYTTIADGVGSTSSTNHAGDSAWAWVILTRTVDASATVLRLSISVNTADEIAYADGAKLFEEAGIADGTTGVPINIMGGSLTPEGYVMDGIDDYLWIPNAAMKKAGLDFTTENMTIVVYGEFNAGTAIQMIVGTRNSGSKGWGLRFGDDEKLYFETKGASDITTSTAAGQVVGTEKATFGMARSGAPTAGNVGGGSVDLYKNGNNATVTSGAHVDLTSSDQILAIGTYPLTVGSWPLNATLKALLIFTRPFGNVEMSNISRDMVEVFG